MTLLMPGAVGSEIDGVRFVSVPVAKGRVRRMWQTTSRLARAAMSLRADAYHLHDPELLRIAPILIRSGAAVIYDAHEDYPKAILNRQWLAGPLRRMIAGVAGRLELSATKRLAGVVAATASVARRFDGQRVIVVQNFPESSEFGMLDESRTPLKDRRDELGRRVVAYVGGISEIRGCRQMVASMGQLRRPSRARLRLAGVFSPPELQQVVMRDPGWAHVDVLGWLQRDQMARLLKEAYAGLVVVQPVPNLVDAYPVKMFEYMAAGIPVIASDFPLWREIVEGADCGLLVDPRDPGAIAAAIDRLIDDPDEADRLGTNGRRAIADRFNWSAQGDRLIKFYSDLEREREAHA